MKKQTNGQRAAANDKPEPAETIQTSDTNLAPSPR